MPVPVPGILREQVTESDKDSGHNMAGAEILCPPFK